MSKLDELRSALDDMPELDDDPNATVFTTERNPLAEPGLEVTQPVVDRFSILFRLQREFMEMLREHGKIAEWPVDLTSKTGQHVINTTVWDSVRELVEAVQNLKNKTHRVTDDRSVDRAAYLEELSDAFAFFLEVLIMSEVSEGEFYEAWVMKNMKVRRRLLEGY